MSKNIRVVDLSEPKKEEATKYDTIIQNVDSEQVEEKPLDTEVKEVRAIEPQPEEDGHMKLTKTLELVECPKCGKKLTMRTLKYSHPSVCPKNPNKPQQAQAPKLGSKQHEASIPRVKEEEEPNPELTPYEQRMLRIRERQEKIKRLASLAF